jgi:hypothetical protein
MHKDSIPLLPSLGEALSRIPITLPVPHLSAPDDPDDDDDDDKPRFIRGATVCTFTLQTPLKI